MAQALVFSALTNIVSAAVGLVSDKVYDGVANQFQDGDVASESIHEAAVDDLKDVISKLKCLSLKDLDASYSFLEEGVQLLNLVLDTSSHASNERFLSAKSRFRASREEATRAFNNKSLSTANRIMACKLRVAASILESGLEDPEIAIAACLVSLKELHGLPGIQSIFSVFLKGGFMSWLNTEERLEIIMSVLSLNHALFDFASKHSNEYPNVFTWPGIEVVDRKVHPILHGLEILEKTSNKEEFSLQLSRIVIPGREEVTVARERFFVFTMNSRSEVVQLYHDKFTVIKNTGEREVVMFPETNKIITIGRRAIAVDSNDNVYATRIVRAHHGKKDNVVLDVFDENYHFKRETTLNFLDATSWNYVEIQVKIAVDKNENIIMTKSGDNHVYICDSEGQLKFQFQRDSSEAYSLSTTNNNDIMIPSDDHHSICVYTTEGHLKSTFKTPDGHEIEDVAFHHGMNKVIVLTSVKEQRHKSLLCYSETGELEISVVLYGKSSVSWYIRSHLSGPFTLLYLDSANTLFHICFI